MSRNKKQFAVLGLGRFGMNLAKELSINGYDVMAVDAQNDKVQIASEFAIHAVCADVTDEASLKAIGLSNFDVAVVAIGGHLDSSVMSTLIAKELGVKYVIAKAFDRIQKRILEKIGADRIVMPERDMGVKVAHSLMYSNFTEFTEISDNVGIIEIRPLDEWLGKNLIEIEIRAKYGLNVVAVKNETFIETPPSVTRKFEKNDILLVLGANKSIQNFLENNDVGEIF